MVSDGIGRAIAFNIIAKHPEVNEKYPLLLQKRDIILSNKELTIITAKAAHKGDKYTDNVIELNRKSLSARGIVTLKVETMKRLLGFLLEEGFGNQNQGALEQLRGLYLENKSNLLPGNKEQLLLSSFVQE